MYQWLVSLEPQVSPALRDPLALLALLVRVLKASLDPKDPLDLLELLVAQSLANLDLLVDLENLVAMEHLVRGETLEPLALRDLGEPPDLLEALDLQVSPPLASPVLQVCLEQWDQEASLV